jgi:hypothetical protein
MIPSCQATPIVKYLHTLLYNRNKQTSYWQRNNVTKHIATVEKQHDCKLNGMCQVASINVNILPRDMTPISKSITKTKDTGNILYACMSK